MARNSLLLSLKKSSGIVGEDGGTIAVVSVVAAVEIVNVKERLSKQSTGNVLRIQAGESMREEAAKMVYLTNIRGPLSPRSERALLKTAANASFRQCATKTAALGLFHSGKLTECGSTGLWSAKREARNVSCAKRGRNEEIVCLFVRSQHYNIFHCIRCCSAMLPP